MRSTKLAAGFLTIQLSQIARFGAAAARRETSPPFEVQGHGWVDEDQPARQVPEHGDWGGWPADEHERDDEYDADDDTRDEWHDDDRGS